MIISKLACVISKILLILGSYKFLAYLESIRSYAWLNGHSDPDLSSVSLDLSKLLKLILDVKTAVHYFMLAPFDLNLYLMAFHSRISLKRVSYSSWMIIIYNSYYSNLIQGQVASV